MVTDLTVTQQLKLFAVPRPGTKHNTLTRADTVSTVEELEEFIKKATIPKL